MIYCFSGTGNSLWIAQRLADTLGDRITLISSSPTPAQTDGERVVWVFPIYSWGLPPVVRDFIRNTKIQHGQQSPHYLVCTCGDDIGLAHKMWHNEIARRRWTPLRAFSVQMPNTYTLMKGFDVDSPETTRQKLEAAPARVDYIARLIKDDKNNALPDDITTGRWAWIKTRIIYPYFMRFCMSPKPFHATKGCVGCGKCASECPLQNIVMDNRHPRWGENCTMCLRCYHICPHHAVEYGKATIGKGQYLHP